MCSWKRSCPFQSRRKEEGRVRLETSFPLKLVLIVLAIFPLLSKSCFEEIKPLQEQKRFWFSLKEIHPYYDSDTYDGNQKRACRYRGYNKQHKVKSEQKKKSHFLSGNNAKVAFHIALCNRIKLKYSLLCLLLPSPCILSLPVQSLPLHSPLPRLQRAKRSSFGSHQSPGQKLFRKLHRNLICFLKIYFLIKDIKISVISGWPCCGPQIVRIEEKQIMLQEWRSFIWKLGKEINVIFRYMNDVKASNWNKIIIYLL